MNEHASMGRAEIQQQPPQHRTRRRDRRIADMPANELRAMGVFHERRKTERRATA